MHIGGGLSRLRSGDAAVHLAEILAAAREPWEARRDRPVFLGMPTAPPGVGHLRGDRPFPEAAADGARRRAAAPQPRPRDRDDPGQARRASSPSVATGRSCGPRARRSRTTSSPTSTRYLVQLEEQVTARGGIVHWARDADEANRIVTELVAATGATEVVKVKSMATQEIGLNEALRGAGIAAWETDLAELIVQLGDDTAAPHPGARDPPQPHRDPRHLRARDGRVGRAAPDGLTDDPAALAEAARLHLREKFLRARSRSAAPTSRSPRPARWPSSSPRATAGCA